MGGRQRRVQAKLRDASCASCDPKQRRGSPAGATIKSIAEGMAATGVNPIQ